MEKEEFENRDSRSPKGEIDLVRRFGGPHVTWSLRLRRAWIQRRGRKDDRSEPLIEGICQRPQDRRSRLIVGPEIARKLIF
jgi:hypothetical protein